MTFTPTFSYYAHVIALNRAHYLTGSREQDYSISLEEAKKIDLKNCKLVILCSPNNPSGNLLEEAVLDFFLEQDLIVMVDEAYHEFSDSTYQHKIEKHNNLIILRTFSKCFGLAGLRVGYGMGNIALIKNLMKIKPPFSVNIAAEVALKTCLKNLPFYQNQVNEIKWARDWTLEKLNEFKLLKPFPSHSNFILCRVDNYDAAGLCSQLERMGILIRYFATNQLSDYIRISIGRMDQMQVLIEGLRNILND